jgi:hypothetical protein
MTTNVPQDVIDDIESAGFWVEGESVFAESSHQNLLHRLAKFAQLRAQRQQGAEPDVVYVADYYGDSLIGKYDENEKLYFMPDGDGYTKEQLAEFDAQFFHSTPPQANALVAAAYRKAVEICDEQSARARSSSGCARALSCRDAILSNIPADAEAALRERDRAVCQRLLKAVEDHYDLSAPIDLDGSIVNSVLGEGGK